MCDILGMHVAESVEDLSAEVLDQMHWNGALCLAQSIFKAALTVLHHDVLDNVTL